MIRKSDMSSDPGNGLNYWRSLQELADTDEYRHQLENEFPGGIDAPPEGMSRRRFLQVMSASIAMTTLAGCRWPAEKIVPFVHQPAGVMPGKPMQFATTMELGPVATSVLATSYDGRPIKIDGNPDSPLSKGATTAFAQASVLDVYDPDRSKKVLRRSGQQTAESDWNAFTEFATERFGGGLKGVAILTGASTSPARNALLVDAASKGAGIFMWEPVCRVNEMRGAKLAFGTAALTQLDFSAAKVVVDFDANFMQDHPTALRNSKQFSAGRDPEAGHMNRLYVYENTYSITGGMADHRFPTAHGHIAAAAWALAAELVLGEGLPLPAGSGISRGDLNRWRGHAAGSKHIAAVAKDLMDNRGHGLLVAGLRQAPEVHALLHVLNAALDNAGKTVSFLPIDTPGIRFIDELVAELNAGRVKTLVVLDSNPVYTAPADLDFAAAMAKAPTRIHLGHRDDATGRQSTWHIPLAHYLESWGDAMGWDLSHLAVQPLIAPLYDGKTVTELLSVLTDAEPRSSYTITRDSFHRLTGGAGAAPDADPGFEKKWRAFIHDGLRQGSGQASGRSLALVGSRLTPPPPPALSAENLELSIVQDQSVHDGRYADNAWLQEMPDFMTKLTWDNAALISPATADELGVKHGDVVELDYQDRRLEMAVYVLPGQATHSVTVNLGYGRMDAGRVGQGMGFDTYRLRTWDRLHGGAGLTVRKTGATYPLATTQDHHAIDNAGAEEIQKRVPALVREGNLQDYQDDPEFVDHLGVHTPPLKSLWKEWEYTGYKWGMAIDLNLCNGCNACIIGCQSENNIPVVGKDEVGRGREMSWVRLDRYFLGDAEDPKVAQQPVACAHCETAPCEQVCPVAATLHTDEGLNAMVYNRCVGTRYCANNCPYKVRRFNWFNNFEDLTETQRLVLNPNVTVRARGVMEKCTYCVQRIETARVDAKVEGRGLVDGDITTACQATCPTEAIVFGDLNDPASRVSKLREASRSYDLLNYLNLKPRTFYMARIRNPNPAIAPARSHGAGHGGGHEEGHDKGHEEHGAEAGAHG